MTRYTTRLTIVANLLVATAGCSGCNGHTQSGIPGDGSTQRTPFATAGREVYSGDGAISGIDTTSTTGVAAHTTYTATYTISSDCSATYTCDSDPTNPHELTVDPSGAEFAYVATGAQRVAAGYQRRR